MVKAESISKTYRIKTKAKRFSRSQISYVDAVKNLDLQINPGEIIGLLGVNGAGKTTTVKMLTTMISPSAGNIYIDGIDAVKDHFEAKKIINVITGGERNIYWRLSARENLDYFGSLYGIQKKVLAPRIENVLEIVGLSDSIDIPVEKYSKGMKQRLQIARGLINDPKYLFLDEPTLGLDIVIAKELRAYISSLASEQNKGILLTTHYISEAEELCDYIYIIDNGEIIAKGTAEELKSNYSTNFKTLYYVKRLNPELNNRLKDFGEDININIDEEKLLIEVISPNDISLEMIDLIKKYDIGLEQIISDERSLEDTLLKILSKEAKR